MEKIKESEKAEIKLEGRRKNEKAQIRGSEMKKGSKNRST